GDLLKERVKDSRPQKSEADSVEEQLAPKRVGGRYHRAMHLRAAQFENRHDDRDDDKHEPEVRENRVDDRCHYDCSFIASASNYTRSTSAEKRWDKSRSALYDKRKYSSHRKD